ncbi:methyl-accepting chemotaxis protein [Carboxydothermus hydrogenoformans]|uniref:Methyl-accepting chemotaxis protein n=1 Tax=Carboxydothermus hydrogenoformans (strain ATCC BAA-161 / DSM 6008 / Z-2901) TaxID=246194 RepID=Q3AFJ6_CARHZ|nr:methyl-accepting chemotaxis protein [Carboxydothermus hydrogenoformans]ABB13859.1 methyl-accepting chemotaxis protein [Carboxydothermus hydrogenoformans Z-2901]
MNYNNWFYWLNLVLGGISGIVFGIIYSNFIFLLIGGILVFTNLWGYYFIYLKEKKEFAKILEFGVAAKNKNLRELLNYQPPQKGILNELGETFKFLGEQIYNSVKYAGEDAQTQSEIIESLTSAFEQVATGTQHQVGQIQNLTLSLEKLAKEINEVAKLAANTEQLAQRARELTQKGVKQSEVAGQEMESISQSINDLEKNSANIAAILEVINEIADQTSLLALNAAIEAARAGEAGRGFAVVADEVRKLADKSRESVMKIEEIIKDVQGKTKVAVNNTKNGVAAITSLSQAFNEINTHVQEMTEYMAQVSEKTEIQAAASEEVSGAAQTIAAVIEEISASTQEIAATSKKLTEINAALKEHVASHIL